MASVDSLSIQITASTTSAQKKVDALVKSLQNLSTAINGLDVSKFETLSNTVAGLSSNLSSINGAGVKSIKDLGKALNQVSTTKNPLEPIVNSSEKVATEAQAAAEGISEIPEQLNEVNESSLEGVAEAISQVGQSANATAQSMGFFKSILSTLKIIVPTEGLDKVNDKIAKLEDRAQELKDRLAYKSATNPDYVDSEEMAKDQKQIEALINELDRLKLKKQELESHGGFKLGWNTTFAEMGKKIETANARLKGFISNLHKSKTASKASAKGAKEFSLSANKLAKEIFRVSKMLKLMVTRMALRAVIKEVGNGFKSLALHSEEFNQSMSGMMNASKKLSYSFSAMVGPLVNALAPALIYLLNILTRLINAINQIFSALSGKSSYNKAKDFTDNWAENIADANDEAKKLKKTVLGFDELNQMQDNTSTKKTDSDDIKDMFDTVEIETKWKKVADYIKNLAKRLFDPIKKAWAKVGDFVKKSWKYALGEVLKLGKSVARDFWKVWQEEKTQKIFENILKIIGYIGLAVGNLAKRFREAWDENGTGLRILRAIRDIVLIITNYLVRMAKATADWADKLNFKPLLKTIASWLESLKPVVAAIMGIISDFYEKVVLKIAKWVIEEGMPKLIQVFIDFNNKVEWDKLKERLSTLWDHVAPFMTRVGEGLIMFIDECAQALAEFVNGDGFESFLTAVEEWMDSVTAEDIKNAIEVIVKSYVAFKVLSAILTVLSTIVGVVKTIGAAISGVIVLLKAALVVAAAILGLELGAYLGSLFDPETYGSYVGHPLILLYDTVIAIKDGVEMLIEDFKNLFSTGNVGSMSRLTDFVSKIATLTGHGYEGLLLEGLSNHLEEVSIKGEEAFAGVERMASKTDEAFEQGAESANNFSEAAQSSQEMIDKMNEKVDAFREYTGGLAKDTKEVSDQLKNAKDDAGDLAGTVDKTSKNIKDMEDRSVDLSKTLYNTSEEFRNLSNNIHDTKAAEATYKSAKEGIAGSSKEIEKALKDIDTSYLDKLFADLKIDTLGDYEDFAEGIETNSDDIQSVLDGIELDDINFEFDDFELNTDKSMDAAAKSVNDGTKDITKDFNTIKDSMTKDKWTFQGVADGLGEAFRRAKEAIKKEWNEIANTLNGEHEFSGSKIKIDLPKFAMGGFPENGIFMANSSELVGRFDNGKTAVANNEQIIAGISRGVYSAVTAAMERSNSGNTGYIANTIVVDGEVIARTVTKAQQRQNMRYSPVMG